jgi:hypothetical protein
VQGTSRALSEEVAFDRAKMTSVDWTTYPILDITEAPEMVDIVLLNRPDLPPAGAGESSIRTVAAALANAVFDATGVRLRRAPLTRERLKPLLAWSYNAYCSVRDLLGHPQLTLHGGQPQIRPFLARALEDGDIG